MGGHVWEAFLCQKNELNWCTWEREQNRAVPDEIPKKLIHIDAARRERKKFQTVATWKKLLKLMWNIIMIKKLLLN